jgi:hypothetical protein
MTQEFIDRLFAEILGKEMITSVPSGYTDEYSGMNIVKLVEWSPSIDSEATKEVRDFMQEKLLEWWGKYLNWIARGIHYDDYTSGNILNAQLSISNLAQYIVDNPEMFYEECPKCQDGHVPVGEYQHYGLVSREMAMDAGNIDLMGSLTPCGTEIEWGQCQRCNGTGKIVKPQFSEAVRVIEEMKEVKE